MLSSIAGPGNTFRNKIVVGDCLEVMPSLPAHSANLIFADPPFNINLSYDTYKDDLPKDEYLAWTERWLSECGRLLHPDGSMFVAIGDEYAAEIKVRLDDLGLHMRNWIIWHYTFGVACKGKFSRSHAHIFYYVKNPAKFMFNAEAVRVMSARQAMGDKRAASGGKVPDDTWVLRPHLAEDCFRVGSDTWAVSRVCGTFNERTDHPCQMPEAVLERIIRVASAPGDLVLDPFAGSGTTLAVALKQGRDYIGVELSKEYALGISGRLKKVRDDINRPPEPTLFPVAADEP